MHGARRTVFFCLLTACVVFLGTLYTINLGVVSSCHPTTLLKQHLQRPHAGSSPQKTDQLSLQNLSTNTHATSPTVWDHHSAFHRPEELMQNISLADLRHLMETDGLNNTAFINWAKSYIFGSRKLSFEMPRWTIRGSTVCNNDTQMIIIMPAVPHHDFVRVLIRQTWASSLYGMHFPQLTPSSLRTKIVFTFGTSGLSNDQRAALKKEAARYKDIVAADFVDSYRNLSLKMMVSLNWVKDFCGGAKYVVKSDLDTFVNIPLFSRFLEAVSGKVHRYIIGHKHMVSTHPVMRTGRWQIQREDYPFDVFPPYLLGHSYVLTADLIPLMVYIGQRIPLIPIEDALITGLLARVVEAPRIHYEGFACVFKAPVSCKVVHNYEVSVTRMTHSRLVMLWRDVLNNNCSDSAMPEKSSSDLND